MVAFSAWRSHAHGLNAFAAAISSWTLVTAAGIEQLLCSLAFIALAPGGAVAAYASCADRKRTAAYRAAGSLALTSVEGGVATIDWWRLR